MHGGRGHFAKCHLQGVGVGCEVYHCTHIVRLGCRESGEHFGRERGEKKRQTETAKKLASWMPDSLSTSKYLRREGILRLCKTGVEPWRARERGERFAENINVIPTIRSTGGGQGPGVGGDQPQGSKI